MYVCPYSLAFLKIIHLVHLLVKNMYELYDMVDVSLDCLRFSCSVLFCLVVMVVIANILILEVQCELSNHVFEIPTRYYKS